MGQVQSQPQVQQPTGFWSLFGVPTVVNPGQSVVYRNRPVTTVLNTSQKVPNVKPVNTTNKNKNKTTAATPVNAPLANVQAPAQNTSQNQAPAPNTSQNQTQVTSGGKRGKKKTRRTRTGLYRS